MKKNKYTFAILGGDRRQSVVAEMLSECGHRVRVFGINDAHTLPCGVEHCNSLKTAIAESEVIILPLPASRDNIHLCSTKDSDGEELLLTDIVKYALKCGCKTVLGGLLPHEFVRMCEESGISAFDYYKTEELQRKNALPSAEGAIMLAMEHTDITVSDMKAVVCGYGRIGTLLTYILSRMGAEVTVLARRDESLCSASLGGHRAIRLGDNENICCAIENCDVIFNTVPHNVFTQKTFEGLTRKPLYIEIASPPYGIDRSEAHDAGIKMILAPSLPGKYAAVSAGKYIFETASELLASVGIII